ncbi:MAG: AAA family ATPase [Aquisalimonadaceae bacterium]
MYLTHFGLKDHPFRLTPDDDFFYMSRSHARAKAYMDYTVVSRDGFVVITGEIGAGKTTLLNKVVAETQESIVLARIDQTQLNETEFLQAVVSAFGMEFTGAGKVELLNRLKTFLLGHAEHDHRVVLAVDEAQSLSYAVLEEIRLLSGIEANKTKLLSVMLMGQPELADVIDAPEMQQLSQRVRLRFHLGPLERDESRDYIRHRLAVAGAASEDVFTEEAYPVIQKYAGGIPRLINSLCDMAMLSAFVDDARRVTPELVEVGARELGWQPFPERTAALKLNGAGSPAAVRGRKNGFGKGLNYDLQDVSSTFQAYIAGMAQGFENLRTDLQGIERQLAEVARRLDRD